MKIFARLFVLTLGSIIFLLPVSSASADEFIGTFCWLVEVDDDEGGEDEFLQLGLNHIGDNHYTVNGLLSEGGETDPEEVNLFSGNAELVGENIVISLHGTKNIVEDNATQSISITTALPFTNFSGPFAAIITESVTGFDEADVFRITGTLTIADCP